MSDELEMAGTWWKRRLNLDQIGLVDRINESIVNINYDRKGFVIIRKELKGRIYYERGIVDALYTIMEA